MIKTAGRTKQAAMFGENTKDLRRFFQREKIDPRVAKRIRMYGDNGFIDPYTAAMLKDREAAHEAADDYGFDGPDPALHDDFDTEPYSLVGPTRDSFVDYTRNRSPEEAARGINRTNENTNSWVRDRLRSIPLPSRQDYIDAGYTINPLKPLNRYFRANGLSSVDFPDPDIEEAEEWYPEETIEPLEED